MQIIRDCKKCELGSLQFETNKHCINCKKAFAYILTKEEYELNTLIINSVNEKLDKILEKLGGENENN